MSKSANDIIKDGNWRICSRFGYSFLVKFDLVLAISHKPIVMCFANSNILLLFVVIDDHLRKTYFSLPSSKAKFLVSYNFAGFVEYFNSISILVFAFPKQFFIYGRFVFTLSFDFKTWINSFSKLNCTIRLKILSTKYKKIELWLSSRLTSMKELPFWTFF